MRARSTFLALTLGLSVASGALATGCGGPRSALYAPTSVVGETVLVRIKDAYVKGDRVVVKTWMKNTSDEAIAIDRDGIALRTPDGRLFPRAGGRTTRHQPYTLLPGEGHDVYMDFRLGDRGVGLGDLVLVLGGVSSDAEPEPRVVGELSLSSDYRPSRTTRPALDRAASVRVESGASEGEGDEDAHDEPDDDDGGDWEIGDAG